ncbi:MAG: DUF2142 domain-containing protein [Anaerolineae bacterium]|nr:DUF2142 domain-containing protein [Anaerolineae bacterium]
MSRPRGVLLLILALYGLLAAAYAVVNPPFEAPDENHHVAYAHRLAIGGGLPVLDPDRPDAIAQEATQPPLYYALSGLIWQALGPAPALDLPPTNPHAILGVPLAAGNKNHFLHGGDEAWPWRGTTLAVRVLRLFSVLLGLVTVWLTYRLGLLATRGRPEPALAAAGLVAFIPQYLFITAAVTNDNLILLLATLCLWLLARLVVREGPPRMVETLALGLAVGLACLSKLGGLLLLIPTALVWLWWGWRRRAWSRALAHLALIGLLVAAVAGWWYVRNTQLYGDPTGITPHLALMNPPQVLTWATLPAVWQGVRISLFATFGWFNLILPEWVYRLWDLFLVLAVLGFVWGIRRRGPALAWPVAGLLAVWGAVSLLALFRWIALAAGAQGRLLLPAYPALAVLLVAGWERWPWPGRWGRVVGMALPVAGALVAAVLALVLVIAPAYRRPPLVTATAVPTAARIPPVVFAERWQLLGLALTPTTIRPGEAFDLTLYWQALAPTATNASLFLRLWGPGDRVVAQWDTYPGGGNFPTSLWPVGPVVVDRYRLTAPPDAPAPTLLRLDVGFYEYTTRSPYPRRETAAFGPLPGLAGLRVLPADEPTFSIPQPTAFTFGESIRLLGFGLSSARVRAGEDFILDLYWQATAPVAEDWQVFIHLLDAEGRWQVGDDGPPREGWWPTSAWEPSQVVHDPHVFDLPVHLPPGRYTLAVGLYRLTTLERLPAAGPPDAVKADAALLTTVEVWR